MSRRFPSLLGLALCSLALAPALGAQVRHPGVPATAWATLLTEVPTEVVEQPDVAAYLAEDELRGPRPLRYGAVIEVSLGYEDQGTWEVAPDGSLVWRLRIASPGAYSLGVIFDEFHLPSGGRLFLYDDARELVLGAYTDENNKANGQFGVEPVPGSAVTIEYVQQDGVTEMPRLRVGQVIHDYRDIFGDLIQVSGNASTAGGGGASGGCSIVDINCPDGNNYQDVKDSVVRILAEGFLCSGALLNNTDEDGSPFLLTASHCGTMTNGIFRFRYERPGCGTGSAPTNFNLSGATTLAFEGGNIDSQLLQLGNIPANYQPFFAGWSRGSPPTTSSPAVTIGHGDGNPKQIATDNSGAIRSFQQWQVFWHSGTIVGGNSGGPLFDGNKRVIGPACCVNQFVCGNQTAWYGRFDLFWNTDNLAQWLDPAGLDPSTLDGFDPDSVPPGPPTVTSLSLTTVKAIGGDVILIDGSGFTGATSVEVGPTVIVPPSFLVLDDNTIRINAPAATTLGSVPVSVSNAGGPSNTVSLTYEVTDPPLLFGSTLTTTAQPYVWNFGGDPSDLWFLFVSGSSLTVPIEGIPILAGNAVLLKSGSLNTLGLGSTQVGVKPSLAGSTVHTQVVTLDETLFTLGGTNVLSVLFLF